MTDHPAIAAGCTKAQTEAFERIAVGQTAGFNPRTLRALKNKGLIDYIEHSRQDRFGTFTWQEPSVPLHQHSQWCKWCAENVEDIDDKER